MSKKYIKSKIKIDEDEIWALSPKGCAAVALIDNGFVDIDDDEKIESFWREFEELMRKNNYIHEN